NRIGASRMIGAYAYRTLLNTNGWIALGTDFPVEHPDPLMTFFAAVFRKDRKGNPADGFLINERLSREEALRGMTIWAAKSNFEEDEKGSLEKGKFADFVVLNQDLLNVREKDFFKTQVNATYINGERVYSYK
ncbi:MAG TPA: amidohydrolase family protein, partial [Flavobacteriales bacterium]|nr:amidohydrolase family protein [Flavobacteriales bacterium]